MMKQIIGVDTCGDGSLAGPVTAGAVMFNKNNQSIKLELMQMGLNDSKKLSPTKRYKLEDILMTFAKEKRLYYSIYDNSSIMIDTNGIKSTSLNAMNMAVIGVMSASGLKVSNNTKMECLLMVDGTVKVPDLVIDQVTIIRGDQKVPEIMAASVLAKCNRDKIMIKHFNDHPVYNWTQNKGYGTQQHVDAIKKFGLSPLHRRSFCQKFVK